MNTCEHVESVKGVLKKNKNSLCMDGGKDLWKMWALVKVSKT